MLNFRHNARRVGGLILALLLPVAAHAGPRLWGWEATFRASASLGYETNVEGNSQGGPDWRYRGGLDIDLRRDRSDAVWQLNFGTDLFQFSSEENDNTNDFRASLRFDPNQPKFGSRYQGSGSLQWTRATETDPQLGDRLQRDAVSVNYDGLFSPNAKWSLGASGSYRWQSPRADSAGNYSDVANWSLSSTAYYRTSSKLAFTLSASHTRSSGQGNTAFQSGYESIAVSGGLDGRITPKISGSLSVGWQFRDAETATGTDAAPVLNAALDWSIDSRTALSLVASSEFSSLVSDQLSESQTVSLSLNRTLGIDVRINASLSYRTSTVERLGLERDDDTFSGQINASYRLNESVSLRALGEWTIQQSSERFYDHDRQTAELGFNFTY